MKKEMYTMFNFYTFIKMNYMNRKYILPCLHSGLNIGDTDKSINSNFKIDECKY